MLLARENSYSTYIFLERELKRVQFINFQKLTEDFTVTDSRRVRKTIEDDELFLMITIAGLLTYYMCSWL